MEILKLANEEASQVKNLKELENLRVKFLGKQGLLTAEMKKLSNVSDEVRKTLGVELNTIKQDILNLIDNKQAILEKIELEARFKSEKLDLTIPARPKKLGSIHPITQCMEELVAVFSQFGLSLRTGPNIETDWFNFTALNIDENHPARQMHDTFYLHSGHLLRTHTSPIQIRAMQNESLPYRFIAPGRTYRSDSDMTHTPMFHQIEGLVIDKDIHMGHLKFVITEFIKAFFEAPNIEVRFRPSFFPFTEPSLEVDIRRNGSESWLEVLGCGMVHPRVLKNVDINPDEYQGFAFGLGVERFAMLKYGIKDLRQVFEGDIRWLKHYNFASLDIPSLTGGLTR
jgi:phenylalanyl-tRNA synthetase alpha chain